MKNEILIQETFDNPIIVSLIRNGGSDLSATYFIRLDNKQAFLDFSCADHESALDLFRVFTKTFSFHRD